MISTAIASLSFWRVLATCGTLDLNDAARKEAGKKTEESGQERHTAEGLSTPPKHLRRMPSLLLAIPPWIEATEDMVQARDS
jgi:hypothetical protein